MEVPMGPGYVPPSKYESKARHKQLDKVLCERCSELCNGAMIPAVEDWTQRLQAQALLDTQATSQESLQLLGKALVTPDQLRTQLMEVAGKKAVVVLLVDLTDASGTLMAKVRDMVGRNPIVLVGTKMDLLPEGTHPRDVSEWLQEAAQRKALNIVSCHLVSSHTGEGVPTVTGKICRERKGRDVYVVGAANVGKSAFVRAMLKEMAKFEGGNFDPAALANGRYLPVESPMPGTTLGIIPLRAFASGGNLFDTPGVHLHHRVPHMLSPSELKLLHPRKRLQPLIPRTLMELSARVASTGPGQQASDPEQASPLQQQDEAPPPAPNPWEHLPKGVTGPGLPKRGPAGPGARRAPLQGSSSASGPVRVRGTYTWSGLVRVDVLDAPPSAALAFVGPSSMRVAAAPLVTQELKEALAAVAADARQQEPPPLPLPGAQEQQQRGANGAQQAITEAGGPGDTAPAAAPAGAPSRVLSCEASVAARGGLVPHLLKVKVDGSRSPLADVAVSGVPGWITVWAPGGRKDISLYVWAPKGVEVFLRPPLPCPSPFTALAQRAQASEDDDDAAGLLAPSGTNLSGSLLQQLASEYEGGGAASGINDAAWWEAAIEELGAVHDEGEEDWDDEEVEDEEVMEEEEEEDPKPRRPRLGGLRRLSGGVVSGSGGERIVMQATVEDILRRPRLDFGLAELDFNDEEGEDQDGAGEEDLGGGQDGGKGQARPLRGARVRAGKPASHVLVEELAEEDKQLEAAAVPERKACTVARPQRRVGIRGRRGLTRAG